MLDEYKAKQESIPVGWVIPACADRNCFNSHQMTVAGGPQVNKFEQVSSGGHQMSLAGNLGQD